MIPMECPSCGRGGNVPNDRLNTRLHCKKCDAVFHIDMSGHVMLGEPVSPDDVSGKRARAAVQTQADPIADLVDSIKSLPKAVRYAGGAIALVVAAVFLLPLVGIHLIPEPEPADTVAVRAARALLEGDTKSLEALATSKTRGDVASWISSARPTLFPGISEGPNPSAIIGATTVIDKAKQGYIRSEVLVIPPGPSPGKPGAAASFYVELIKSGRAWRVDAGRSKILPPTTRKARTNTDTGRDMG